ncbi:Tetratricopeptide repeat protein 1, partial [Stegodyphus mimosarum]
MEDGHTSKDSHKDILTNSADNASGSSDTNKFDLKSFTEALSDDRVNASSAKTEIEDDDEDDEEYSDAKDLSEADEVLELDEEAMAECHKDLSDDKLEKLKEEAVVLKNNGNECFKKSDYEEAVRLYTTALNTCPLKYQSERSILYANRAAAKINLEKNEEAILDCNKALELNPSYLKALLRRASLYRKMDRLDNSLEDYQKVLELDRNNAEARQACAVLPAEIAERNEKLKNEMFGKLKELGNICLRPFGLSTDNFKVVKDPN